MEEKCLIYIRFDMNDSEFPQKMAFLISDKIC